MNIHIRPMLETDLENTSDVHSQVFTRQLASEKWMVCNFRSYPRIMIYVATNDNDQIVGYIQWLQKSGFRKDVVMELEQIAVLPALQGQGIGTQLITQSIQFINNILSTENRTLKAIIVSTRSDNVAQNLYKKVLNAKIVATITDLYSHDEVVLISRFS